MKKQFKLLLSALFCVFLFCAVTPAPAHAATAALNKTSASIYIDKSVKLKVSGTSDDITWSSSDPAIAKVSSTGRVRGLKKGTVTISAETDSETLTCEVTVKRAMSVSAKNLVIARGQSKTVTLTLRPKGKHNAFSSILNSEICKLSWGTFNNTKCTATVFGKKRGVTYIAFTNDYNSEICLLKVIVR